jgi:hypothetical protein
MFALSRSLLATVMFLASLGSAQAATDYVVSPLGALTCDELSAIKLADAKNEKRLAQIDSWIDGFLNANSQNMANLCTFTKDTNSNTCKLHVKFDSMMKELNAQPKSLIPALVAQCKDKPKKNLVNAVAEWSDAKLATIK